jgi:hypothetical protein
LVLPQDLGYVSPVNPPDKHNRHNRPPDLESRAQADDLMEADRVH